MLVPFVALVTFASFGNVDAMMAKAGSRTTMNMMHRNPIRKVVTMLQDMEEKLTEDGKRKQKTYDAFMCECSKKEKSLRDSIADEERQLPPITSETEAEKEKKNHLHDDVTELKGDYGSVNQAIAQAKSLRDKEHEEYKKRREEMKENVAALRKAIPAIEQGMTGFEGFLQTDTARTLRQLSVSMDMNPNDRDVITGFLSEDDHEKYVPKSGEVLGIMKQMLDDMVRDLEADKEAEEAALENYLTLIGAKQKEQNSLQESVEDKTMREGQVAVEYVTDKGNKEDIEGLLSDDNKALGDTEDECTKRQKEHEQYKVAHTNEMLALAETISMLNSDAALDLFKKTLQKGGSSFLQMLVTTKQMRREAAKLLRRSSNPGKHGDHRMDLLLLALRGGKEGFSDIVRMIDDLIGVLEQEQKDDDSKRKYCEVEKDTNKDEIYSLTSSMETSEKVAESRAKELTRLDQDLEKLRASIELLDSQVSQATSQRQQENAEYRRSMADNLAAKELLQFAKKRLNKVYNPGMVLIDQTKGDHSFVQVDTSNIVVIIANIDKLLTNLAVENKEMDMEEDDMQEAYNKVVADAEATRLSDGKAITDKSKAKAHVEAELLKAKLNIKSKKGELEAAVKYKETLAADCDFLIQHYRERRLGRQDELENLGNAKDVLSGASYALLQTSMTESKTSNLRGAR